MSHKPLAIRTASLKRGAFAILVVSSLLISAPSTQAQTPCEYEVTAIIQAPECPPFGFPPTIGTAISEPTDGGLPNVVGYYNSCTIGPRRAFLWIGNEDRFITIPMPAGTLSSEAADIEGTRIVGTFNLEDDGLSGLGFLYDFDTDEFTNLGTLPGGTRSEALALNTAGQIAGYWGNHIIGPWQTFIWDDGVMNDLGPLIGGAANRALDINEKGAITGWWRRQDGGERIAFVWQDRVKTDLGPIPGGFTSEGGAINSQGDVGGFGWMFDKDANEDVRRAFAWIDGETILLGTLPGYPESSAKGINDDRTVVGHAFTNTSRAFVWKDGLMTALNDLVPPELGLNIKVANAINQTGQITGQATSPDGVVALVLTPIQPRLGDLDGDCHVGVKDLLILLGSWGPCDNCENCPADLNRDCVVGVVDLLMLLGNWG